MSRIGKKIIELQDGVSLDLSGFSVTVKGPKGELQRDFSDQIEIKNENGKVSFIPKDKSTSISSRAMWGTTASHVSNMVEGVSKGFEKKLVIEGVGYKSEVSGGNLVMKLGFSHPVEMKIPDGLEVSAEKNIITVFGIDKELVGSFASKVRLKKKPEPYKGKGIRYEDEVIRRKEGKKNV